MSSKGSYLDWEGGGTDHRHIGTMKFDSVEAIVSDRKIKSAKVVIDMTDLEPIPDANPGKKIFE